jgi:hypothetical protein
MSESRTSEEPPAAPGPAGVLRPGTAAPADEAQQVRVIEPGGCAPPVIATGAARARPAEPDPRCAG